MPDHLEVDELEQGRGLDVCISRSAWRVEGEVRVDQPISWPRISERHSFRQFWIYSFSLPLWFRRPRMRSYNDFSNLAGISTTAHGGRREQWVGAHGGKSVGILLSICPASRMRNRRLQGRILGVRCWFAGQRSWNPGSGGVYRRRVLLKMVGCEAAKRILPGTVEKFGPRGCCVEVGVVSAPRATRF